MYNSSSFIDPRAKNSLDLRKQEQETRKLTLIRQQKEKDLKQLETQLFYKKQEVARIKVLFDRMKREAVTKQQKMQSEERDVLKEERQIKDTETRLQKLAQDITHTMSDIGDKISKEKTLIAEHERILLDLEKQKRDFENKSSSEKRTFMESMSRLLFYKKKEEQESLQAKRLFKINQTHLEGAERDLKTFGQEITVLENKIRSLTSSMR